MRLDAAIQSVMELTGALIAAFAADDHAACDILIARRSDLLQIFETRHKMATAAELSACSQRISLLQQSDQQLQQAVAKQRDVAGKQWREALGKSAAPQHNYDRLVQTGCLDRTV